MIIRSMAIGVALAFVVPAAKAGIIYDWTGTCSAGCGGIASATLYLVDNFVAGSPVTSFNGTGTTDILGFEVHMPADGLRPSYIASLIAPSFSIFGTVAEPLLLPALSGTGSGSIFTSGGFMETAMTVRTDGSWQFGSGLTLTAACSEALPPGGCTGTSSQWVLRSVPEPATAFLLAWGLIAVAGLGKLRA